MESFPSNSRDPRPVQPDREERKPNLKVVEGPVVRRKKPLGTRFIEVFFGGSAKSAIENVIADVLVPAFKDTITDAVSTAVERMVFGDSNGNRRRSGNRPSVFGGTGHVNYNRYSSSSNRREERPRRSRSSNDFSEIILTTRRDAQRVLDQLLKILDRYEIVSVRDLYELVDLEFHHTDEKWGWTNLDTAGIRQVSNGYLLVMPEVEPIE